MGSFHILLVNSKILYKRYGFPGLRLWWVKSKIIGNGSVDNTLKRRHYSRRIGLHKQTFEVLVCFKFKSLEKDFQMNFISKVKKLREETTYASLLALCNDKNFK